MINEWHAILKLCIALVLGIIVAGWQYRQKSMILYAHILVCMGTCALALMSIDFQQIYNMNLSMIVVQIPIGVGLLGAVIIMKEESDEVGLTNAASLWIIAAIGMAVGYNYYVAALCTTAISYFTLNWF